MKLQYTLLVLFVISIFVSSLFAPSVFAAKQPYTVELQKHTENVKINEAGQPNLDGFGKEVTYTVQDTLICATIGCGETQSDLKTDAVSVTGKIIADAFASPPASGQFYAMDLLQNIGVQPAYAQGAGLGFNALRPILDIWKLFASVANFLFVVIFLVIGFMIMFRQKMGGQAAVTIQQALPKIIVALILVNFSYAIAGFMIDIMYLIMYLLVGVFDVYLKQIPDILNNNIFGVTAQLFTSGMVTQTANAVGSAVEAALHEWLGAAGAPFGWLASGLTILILGVAILIGMFRTLFALLRVYLEIIFNVIFSPFELMMNALPGQNTFFPWLKRLAANLFVFPVILVMIMIGYLLTGTQVRNNPPNFNKAGFVPPLVPGRGNASTFQVFAGIAIIMAMPEAINFTKKAIGADEGGLGGEILKTGWENIQKGRKWGTRVAVGAPLAVAGGVVGHKFGNRYADRTGLQGGKRRAAQLVGTAIGAGIGPRIPGMAKDITKSMLGQAGDTLVGMETERLAAELQSSYSHVGVQKAKNIAKANKQATSQAPAQGPQSTKGPSKKRTNRLKRP